jgi:hypothetical protein
MKGVLRTLSAIIGIIWVACVLVFGLIGFGLSADALATPDDPTIGFVLFVVGGLAALYAFLTELDE